uniref:SET domain-containing protein 4 n=1 Tax=Cacopsylla melanoneura TaxID=428564 RepID=A0A8D8TKV1_9HEMI
MRGYYIQIKKKNKMGRTGRKRHHKKLSGMQKPYKLGADEKMIGLMQWLVRNGWQKEITLYPTEFPTTGRGLMTKSALNKGDVLVNIPFNLLITAHTVCKSPIYEYLNENVKYDGHEILAFYLVWEKHLNEQSFWYPYINTLPEQLSTPLFWSSDPLNLPKFISEAIKGSLSNMKESYRNFLNHIQHKHKKCTHCNQLIIEIFNETDFIWAWCIVNTRAVYIPLEKNLRNISNSLALAPYLDLFNHVPSAQVEAMLIETQNAYQVKTLVHVGKNEQVFIEYGAHSNLKLLIEYGFTVPNNQHDSISLSLEDIYNVIKHYFQISHVTMSRRKYKFLKKHKLMKNPCLTREGLCWKTMAIIFILTSPINNVKLLESKVYPSLYFDNELTIVNTVGSMLVRNKIKEFKTYIDLFVPAESDQSAVIAYLKECIEVLKVCLQIVIENMEENGDEIVSENSSDWNNLRVDDESQDYKVVTPQLPGLV